MEDCMICYEKLNKNTFNLCCCRQYIHIHCLQTWEKMQNNINKSCPHCRSKQYKKRKIKRIIIKRKKIIRRTISFN